MAYPPQPPGAIIHIHEATDDRLVLDIPPGKGAAGIGLFAVLWNGFLIVFTAIFSVAMGKANGPQFSVVPVLVIFLFWAVGIGFIYAWMKLKFERCFLLVDRNRAVVRRMLLRWQSQKELELDAASRAQLTESYKENERPVYRVTIVGLGGNQIHFGTSLVPAEKDWCVDAINTLIEPQAIPVPSAAQHDPRICKVCGDRLPENAFVTSDGLVTCPACDHQQALPVPAFTPNAVDEETPLPDELPNVVTMIEDSPERLAFSLRWTEHAVLRRVALAVVVVAALVITGLMGGNLVAILRFDPQPANGDVLGQWFGLIFAIPTVFGILTSWLLVAVAAFGQLTTTINREELRVRFHVGPFGRTWKVATPDITAVRLTTRQDAPSSTENTRVFVSNVRVADRSQQMNAAAVFAGPRPLVMTAAHEPLTARFVVAQVRVWLRKNAPAAKV